MSRGLIRSVRQLTLMQKRMYQPKFLPLALGMLLAGAASSACRSSPNPGGASSPPPAAVAAESLPDFPLTDDTPQLLLTWVGDDGDFHVAEAIAQVPAERRTKVRVVRTDQPTGSGATVYVADLTVKRPDGSYAVSTLPRTEWEKLGADLRKTRMEALAPGAASPPGTSAPGTSAPGTSAPGTSAPGGPPAMEVQGAITAIVYGADWCKPCHDAESYLKSLGVTVTKKNIEESRAAQAEMQQKLTRANRTGASIPVIDVMGKIFVGYSPSSLRQAVEAARQASARQHG
jgi:glutaredoxin